MTVTSCPRFASARAENAAAEGRWDQAGSSTARFVSLLELHLSSEEETLFPAFEDKTGMRTGPTAMMRESRMITAPSAMISRRAFIVTMWA